MTALVWVGGLITLALLGYLLFALLAPERLS
ncbi:MAG: K(+)-transporting ATPase subunit F [Myxococcales bacterium]|nr:K(+)-transporting ATPase subunit F [Myxococcales bacterium]HRC57454.1 K(+)-transporting ATPase subunit F [Kofleriaceae bacterium]